MNKYNSRKTKDACGIDSLKTEIKVWSRIGHTPVTGRSGAYSDELVSETTDCTNPHDAEQYVVGLMKRTPHAYTGYFIIHEWWNQNTCSQWVDISQTFEVSK